MVGLAILSGLRRGELFALRSQDIDEESRVLTVREAVYDSTFDTSKTEVGLRQIPLSEAALRFIGEWKQRAGKTEPNALVFSTRTGKAISPNNVLRRAIFPAREALDSPHATWLTFRRTYSSWSHDKGVPGKVIAQLMGHANVDTPLGGVPLGGVLQRRVISLDGVEPLKNCRALAIHVVHRLQAMVVRRHGMLIAIEAFFEHVGGRRGIVQHALDEKVDVPFEDLQLA